jgi:hypothetical protein
MNPNVAVFFGGIQFVYIEASKPLLNNIWNDYFLQFSENTSYSAMLNIPETVPPPESVPCDSGIPH